MTVRNPRQRPVVTAAFAASWDGRLLEVMAPAGPVDAQLSDTVAANRKSLPSPSVGSVLKSLRAGGARRVAFAGSPMLFRQLCAEGLLDELTLTWRPCIGGGTPLTGLAGSYLPHGIVLDLVKLEQRGGECVARYRVQTAAQ
jgi:riboflavin biosynthesis pyrimidine reductase